MRSGQERVAQEICTLRVNGRGLETGLKSGTAPALDPTGIGLPLGRALGRMRSKRDRFDSVV